MTRARKPKAGKRRKADRPEGMSANGTSRECQAIIEKLEKMKALIEGEVPRDRARIGDWAKGEIAGINHAIEIVRAVEVPEEKPQIVGGKEVSCGAVYSGENFNARITLLELEVKELRQALATHLTVEHSYKLVPRTDLNT